MTAKEFLSQAYRLDKKIDWKIQQVESLNNLATKATGTLTGMPRNPSPSTSRLADVVTKIVDLEEVINAEIDSSLILRRRSRRSSAAWRTRTTETFWNSATFASKNGKTSPVR